MNRCILIASIVVLIIIIMVLSAKLYKTNKLITKIEDRFGVNIKMRGAYPRKGGQALRNVSDDELLRPRTFKQYQCEINDLIERAQELEDFGHKTRLSEACGKALAGGKRIRSVILMEIARATMVRQYGAGSSGNAGTTAASIIDASDAALFIEYVHSASLVIDDLPEFDNDLTRRGKPSIHAEMGTAVAQMAALSLVAAAFQNICRQIDWIRDHCPEFKHVDRVGILMCNDISRALGALGAAGGQYMDVSSVDDLIQEHGPEALFDLMYKKTATFFEMAVVIGWLVAGGDIEQVSIMRDIGFHLGTAFQIADDIGDMESDAERAKQGKSGWNFANEYGRDYAKEEVTSNLLAAQNLMKSRGLWTLIWEAELIPAIWSMTGEIADVAT